MTGANAKIKRIMIGDKQVRPAVWKPLDAKCWYKFDGDYTDATGTYGNATGTATFQTLSSGLKVLQTDGTNMISLPVAITNTALTTYTIAFWMKVLTASPTYGYYAGYSNSSANATIHTEFYESTAGRNYYAWAAGTSSRNSLDITPTGILTNWRLVCIRSNGTARSNVSMVINGQYSISGATGGADSSSIFGATGHIFTIGWRNEYATGDTGQKTSIQMSNFVISTSYWDDTECLKCYNMNKSQYGL